ncbi:MAG TPA: HlyD family efflux transporter periplasmic adaptor subunit [Candidatus Binatia bacterium]|nr:HlyD family efflux transporter periplasmic adaptor subunit [Candidatus Binatia bacterium]
MRAAIAAAAVLAVAACGAQGPKYSGTVQTESVAVGSQTGGRIVEVAVAVGTRVHHGSVVLRLDPALLRAQYDQARAQARAAAERLAELENGNVPTDVARAREQSAQAAAEYRQAVAQRRPQAAAQAAAVREAEAALVLAQTNFNRAQSLAATGDVSRQSLDQARADYAQARARVVHERATYANLVRAQLPGEQASARANALAQSANYQTVRNGPRTEEITQARAALAAAEASVAYDRTRLDEAVIVAPADGVVASFNLHPGDLLDPNQQAAIIDTFADPYAYIYASQRDLASLSNGTHLRIVSDAGGATYEGVVEAHDRTAQFTPQSVETADQRADLVYGVKVRIRDPHHRLLSGTTVTVYPP